MSANRPEHPLSELRIAAPDKRVDSSDFIDLLCKTYSVGVGYWNGEKACRDGYLEKSNYDWKASRIGFLNAVMVTHFGIWDFEIRVGCARLCVAWRWRRRDPRPLSQVGPYASDCDCRFKRVLSNSDYDISLFFGINQLLRAIWLSPPGPRRSPVSSLIRFRLRRCQEG